MNVTTMCLGDKKFVKYISEEEILLGIDRIAAQINADYQGNKPVFIITLNGAIFFAVDLLRKLNLNLTLACIKLSSYVNTQSTGKVNCLLGINENLEGKRVVILEDIVDTGTTYEHILNMLKEQNIKDVRIATMTYKMDVYKKPYPIHYAALTIPPKFVVGRGLDYNGLGRHLRDIYQIVE